MASEFFTDDKLKAPGRLSPGPSNLFRSLGGSIEATGRRQANAEPGSIANKKIAPLGSTGSWLLRHRCQRCLRVRANALDHGTEPVRSLRGQVLAQPQPLKHRNRVGR